MKNTVSCYEALSNLFAERYVLGELGEVTQSEETKMLSAKVEGFIDATVTGSNAVEKLNELLAFYTADVMRDAFAAGLRYGLQAGLDTVARGSDDRGPSE